MRLTALDILLIACIVNPAFAGELLGAVGWLIAAVAGVWLVGRICVLAKTPIGPYEPGGAKDTALAFAVTIGLLAAVIGLVSLCS